MKNNNKKLVIALAFTFSTSEFAVGEEINIPRLASVDNFRDVAGLDETYSVANKGSLRAGVFYRSNNLTPNASDKYFLNSLGVSKVIDIRSPIERSAKPSNYPDSAIYVAYSLVDDSMTTVPDMTRMTISDVNNYMGVINRGFVTSDFSREGFGAVLKELAYADGPVIFHCTGGKDRTGWVSAILHTLSGVSEKDIFDNFLATNNYSKDSILASGDRVPESMREIYMAFQGVDSSWLEAGLDELANAYGNMNEYLIRGLGLSQEEIYMLRGKLVIYSDIANGYSLMGNSRLGYELIESMQNSDLSGSDTDFNYYLQKAVDENSLFGLEESIGGQIYSDIANYLARNSLKVNNEFSKISKRNSLQEGEHIFWTDGVRNRLSASGSNSYSSSSFESDGLTVGVKYQFSNNSSLSAGVAKFDGDISAAQAEAGFDGNYFTLGALTEIDSISPGGWLSAQLTYGDLNYLVERSFSGGFSSTKGKVDAKSYSAQFKMGFDKDFKDLNVSTAMGLQYSKIDFDSFSEKGSELSLDFDKYSDSLSSFSIASELEKNIDMGAGWYFTPFAAIEYERIFDSVGGPIGELKGFSIRQAHSFDSEDMYSVQIGSAVSKDSLSVSLRTEYVRSGSGDDGINLSGSVSLLF